MKVRKKPIVVEAWQIPADNDTHTNSIPSWVITGTISGKIDLIPPIDKTLIRVNTLEGPMHGAAGDYIMKGVNDELYICKKEIFEKTYDIVEA